MANAFLWNRYKQKKEVEHRLSALKSAVESGQADDECVREYYLLHLRRWIGISLEEIESIDQEIKILRGKDSSKEVSLVTAYIPKKATVRDLDLLQESNRIKILLSLHKIIVLIKISGGRLKVH